MRAFSLIELIFVIVIMSILSVVAVSYIPKNNRLYAEKQALEFLVMDKKSNAIGFRANMQDDNEKALVCILLDKESINTQEKNKKSPFIFQSDISAKSGDDDIEEICFDETGRVHCGDIADDYSSLCKNNVIISLKLKNKEVNFSVTKFVGAVVE
ncbi:MAG: type II secretion system protein [Epsilonproteobacteria bacterium]|nr:type II secretion system protein [Campylobacterota bacterium]